MTSEHPLPSLVSIATGSGDAFFLKAGAWFSSLDQGLTWKKIGSQLDTLGAWNALEKQAPFKYKEFIYANSYLGLLASADGGLTWKERQ